MNDDNDFYCVVVSRKQAAEANRARQAILEKIHSIENDPRLVEAPLTVVAPVLGMLMGGYINACDTVFDRLEHAKRHLNEMGLDESDILVLWKEDGLHA